MQSLRSIVLLLAFATAALPSRSQEPAPTKDAGADPIPDVKTLLTWHPCTEYLPGDGNRGCRVDFDMTQSKDGKTPAQTHKDISVHLGPDQRGVVALWHSSPFASCSVTTTPGPLGRDLSPNVPGAFTSLAGFGGSLNPEVVPVNPTPDINVLVLTGIPFQVPAQAVSAQNQAQIRLQAQADLQQSMASQEQLFGPLSKAQREQAQREMNSNIQAEVQKQAEQGRQAKAASIEEQERAITKGLNTFVTAAKSYQNIKPALEDAGEIRKQLAYSYDDNRAAWNALNSIENYAVQVVGLPLPDGKTPASLQSATDDAEEKIRQLDAAYGNVSGVHDFVTQANEQVAHARRFIQDNSNPKVVATIAYLTDTQAKVQKILDFVRDWKRQHKRYDPAFDASVQALPIAIYPESKVAVTVKCSDVVFATPLADSIQFNAFFQKPPIFDISSGVLISFLPNRTVTVQTPYSSPTGSTNACTAGATTTMNCPVVQVSRSRPQFIPGVFAEIHLKNFKLPGVHDPALEKADPPTTIQEVDTEADPPTTIQRVQPPSKISTWMSERAPRHPFGYVGSFGLAGGILVNPNSGTTQAEFFEGLSFGIQRFVILFGNHTGRSLNPTNGYTNGEAVAPGTMPTTVNNWSNALSFGITYRIPLR